MGLTVCFGIIVACSDATPARPRGADAGRDSGTSLLGDSAAPPGECGDVAKAIYLVSKEGALYNFDPISLDIKVISSLGCAPGAEPTSMAVDRTGTAWVRHSDGGVYRVSTKDGACRSTSFQSGQEGFFQFGMGYSSNPGGGETLFLSSSSGKGLGSLDTNSFTVRFIGAFTGEFAGKKAELTGTGDGKLFGFFPEFYPAKMGEIDKATGAVSNAKDLTGVEATSEWAFSFFGGDFFAFHAKEGGGLPQSDVGSSVTRYRPTDGTITKVKQLAFRVVGAGVSTCAPTSAPK
jgi:hypothetical protein